MSALTTDTSPSGSQQETEPQLQIAQHEQALLQAMQQSDVAAMERLFNPALLFTLPSGQTITREQDLAGYRAGDMKLTSLVARDQQIRVLGNTAIVVVTVETQGAFQHQSLAGNYRFTRVWQEQTPGHWQVIGGSSMRLADTAGKA